MISIDLEYICILELIKGSLFDSIPIIPENANWEKILKAAQAQCIVPLLASTVPLEHRDEWLEISYKYRARFMQLMHEQNSLVKLYNDNNIPFVILKGTSAAIYYPNPTLRTFGDIDFYVPEEHFNFAKELLDKNGYKFLVYNDRHYVYQKNGFDFELHQEVSSTHDKDITNMVLNGLNSVVEHSICGGSFPSLSEYDNGLVLLGHIIHHLKTYGIGLRQIIDWMMFVHKELDDYNWNNHFKELAIKEGLEKMAITVTYMCKKWLGLPNTITWCDSADENLADLLLIRIITDENFGRGRAPYENVKLNIKKEGFLNYLHHAGVDNWPLAQKYVLLRPLALFYQLCRYIVLGIEGMLIGKNIFKKDKQNLSLEELWKKLE